MADLGAHTAFFPAYLASSLALLHETRRPFLHCILEKGYLRFARLICFGVGWLTALRRLLAAVRNSFRRIASSFVNSTPDASRLFYENFR
jgi:hypothetical protein